MELIIVLLLMLLLAIAALLGGLDSRDKINSSEWEKRREWSKLHPTYHY